MKHPRTLAEIKADPRIVKVWQKPDCRLDCKNGLSYWAELAPGYRWEGCSSLHEDNIRNLSNALAAVYKE